MQRGRIIDFEEGWEAIQKGIKILEKTLDGYMEPPFTPNHYMTFYTIVYKMCGQDYAGRLYVKYREYIERYIRTVVLSSLREKHDEFLLRELVKRWSNHKVMIRCLRKFFYYIESHYTVRMSLQPLNVVGFLCFRDLIYMEMNEKVKDAVISLIEKEREGQQIDRALVKNAIDIFVEIGFGTMHHYKEDFEKDMLKATADYYARKASSWILEDSCTDYMLKAEEYLRLEKEDRVSHYLHFSSEPKLLEKVQHELLSVYATQLLENENSGCHALLRDGKVGDLSRMYRLFSKIPRSLKLVSDIFKQHVSAQGTALVKQADDVASTKAEKTGVVGLHEQDLVRKVIELHHKYLVYVQECFMKHSLFCTTLQESFNVSCNKGVAGSSWAELLVTFCDNILKKDGIEKLNDEAIEQALEKVAKLLACIHDRDVFDEFYRKTLTKRLLNKNTNYEHEKTMLIKLKQHCGGQFTFKMEGMIRDWTLARENQANFEEYLSLNPHVNPGIDLTVIVLTSGFWPSHKSFDLNLPSEMVKCIEVFSEFYQQTKTKSKRLTWIYSLGTCKVNGNFERKQIELTVTTYQAILLLLFNSSDKLSYQEIVSRLNSSDKDVLRLLHSLSCAKYKILVKHPSTKTISPADHFEFNSKFIHKMRTIKIPVPSMEQKKKVTEDVEKKRRYAIDASIVRIMKSRKVLTYSKLVMECQEQLGHMFKPDIKVIKKSLDDLITRDYLERDTENPYLFKYLA